MFYYRCLLRKCCGDGLVRVEGAVLAEALVMTRYALAAYGVPLFVWTNKGCGICSLLCGGWYVTIMAIRGSGHRPLCSCCVWGPALLVSRMGCSICSLLCGGW